MTSQLKKSELVVGNKVAYKRGNAYTLATIIELKTRVKIDDEGEERWVSLESLHNLKRLDSAEADHFSARLKQSLSATSGGSSSTKQVQGALVRAGVPTTVAGVGAVGLVLLLGVCYTFFTTGELNAPSQATLEAAITAVSEEDLPTLQAGGTEEPSTDSSNNPTPGASNTTTGGDWYDLYFTTPIYPDRPENRPDKVPIMEALIAAINSAQSTLDIAIYELNLAEIGEAILAARDRGVKVRMVTDTDEIDHLEVLIDLNEQGIPMVEDDRSAIMHNKFVIVDGQSVWTGSWNFTPNGTYRNSNHGIYIQSPELAQIYTTEFEELFGGAFGPRSPSTPEQTVNIDGTSIEVCFAPEDKCANRLTEVINQAEQSIHIMAFSFTHDDMGAAVIERGQAGVEVRAIFETRGSQTQYSELGGFQQAGFDAVQDGNPYTYHHKAIVIDGEQTVLGSFNFSNNADKSNDENLLIIDNVDIAQQFIAEFERGYEQAMNPPNK